MTGPLIDTGERVPMTHREIGLMKAIIRWHRSQGGTFFLNRKGYGFGGAYGFGEWRSRRLAGPAAAFERELSYEVTETPSYSGTNSRRHEVESVTQAIDLLCALGRLPLKFSSGYCNGIADTINAVRDVLAIEPAPGDGGPHEEDGQADMADRVETVLRTLSLDLP